MTVGVNGLENVLITGAAAGASGAAGTSEYTGAACRFPGTDGGLTKAGVGAGPTGATTVAPGGGGAATTGEANAGGAANVAVGV